MSEVSRRAVLPRLLAPAKFIDLSASKGTKESVGTLYEDPGDYAFPDEVYLKLLQRMHTIKFQSKFGQLARSAPLRTLFQRSLPSIFAAVCVRPKRRLIIRK